MKNFRKFALGFIVLGLTLGFSAFTNASKNPDSNKNSAVTFDYLVQRAIGAYTQINTSAPSQVPNYSACGGSSPYPCTFIVTATGKANIPTLSSLGQTNYTVAQVLDYANKSPNAWLTYDPNSDNALYNP